MTLEKPGDGECSLRVLVRIPARDFRKPWAEDGRLGVSIACPFEGADGDHGFPARSASSYMILRLTIARVEHAADLGSVLGGCPAVVFFVRRHPWLIPAVICRRVGLHEAQKRPIPSQLQRIVRHMVCGTFRMRLTVIRLIWSSCHVSIDTDRTKLVNVVNFHGKRVETRANTPYVHPETSMGSRTL